MGPRKGRGREGSAYDAQKTISDYEDETGRAEGNAFDAKADRRSNAELNLAVLRRHYPDVTSIVSIANYAVVYLFSHERSQWEKIGIEGTMFVCSLTATELEPVRYAVILLNRRSLRNFFTELRSAADVELTEEYVILKVGNEDEPSSSPPPAQIYGLWIFSEPPPSSTFEARKVNAQVIQACAAQYETHRIFVSEKPTNGHPTSPTQGSTQSGYPPVSPVAVVSNDFSSAGRQLSLQELFGQQRQNDSDWAVHNHSYDVTTATTYTHVSSSKTTVTPTPIPQKQVPVQASVSVQHLPAKEAALLSLLKAPAR